jgi:translocation and assembly module TamB
MASRRRVAAWVGGGILMALLLLMSAVLILTQTDWGREQVRLVITDRLDRATDGRFEIRRIEGNLLSRIRLVDVTIVDEQERPFLRADTIFTRFSVRGLLRQRIVLTDLRLVRPVIVLDQPPGEEWNYVRIFRVDPDPEPVDPRRRGWGDWVALSDVEIVDGRIVVRSEWGPPEDLTGEERERAIRRAVAGETRENVVRVRGGHQNVMDFRQLNTLLPRVVVAHPDSAGIPIEVARFSGVVQPFTPPVAEVRDLSGKLRLEKDSLHFTDIRAVLPGSRVTAAGVYALHSGTMTLVMQGAPMAFPDMRWLYPPLPEEGGGNLRMHVERRTLATRIVATEMDVQVGTSTLQGRLDITTGDTLRIGPTDLEFARMETRLVQRLIPALEFPRPGELTGRLALQGPPQALQLDGDVRFVDAAGGPASRVLAVGEIGVQPEMRFRDLRLQFRPLQASLARAMAPDLPVRGTIEGFATLTGRMAGLLQLDSDLTLRDPATGLSRVRATGGIDQTGDLRLRNLLVRVDPLRTALLREQIPQLPARSTLIGSVRLDGYPDRGLQVDCDMILRDPATGASRIEARGGIRYVDELRLDNLLVRTEPLQLDLLREHVPHLPAGATVSGEMRLDGFPARALHLDGDLALDDPRSGLSRLGATGRVVLQDEMRFDDMRFRLHSVQLDLLREQLPNLPPGGILTGALAVDGAPARMLQVDGTLRHHDAALGTSEVGLSGGVALQDPLRFSNLDVRLQPLSMRLVQAFAPDFPVGGTVRGTATLNGSPEAQIAVRGDLVHVEGGQRSHVTGHAVVATGPGGRATIDVTLQPLALATVGRFAPAAGLHGSVSGQLRASGNLDDLRLETDLSVAGGGFIQAAGSLDLASEQAGYDLSMRMSAFNLAALTWRAPASTSLSGIAQASGRGLEPATMRASIAADLRDSEVEGVGADLVRLRLQMQQGLATVDSTMVRLGTADAVVDGSFGLVAGRHGTLAYRVNVDSLHAFAQWLPGAATPASTETGALADTVALADAAALADTVRLRDTVVLRDTLVRDTVAAPPAVQVADAVLGADSALIAGAAPPELRAPADSLAGRLHAAGTLSGNIEAFDAEGSLRVEDLVYGGQQVGRGEAEYAVRGVRSATQDVTITAQAAEVVAGGLAFDGVSLDGQYRGDRYGTGQVNVVAFQDPDRDYRLDAEFSLSLERNELRLADALLRFDTVTWRTAQPGVVSWGGAGVEVDNIDLVSDAGGRIFADGRLPIDGAADMQFNVENLEIAQLAALLQTEFDATGRLDLHANVEGTRSNPVMSGTATLQDVTVNGDDAPELRAGFSYAGRELSADAEMLHDGRVLATVEARLPVDLALTGGVEQRLLGGEIVVDVRADSLPIEAIPYASEHVQDARGRIAGTLSMRGTFDDPVLDGAVTVDLGSVRIVPLGVRFDSIAGSMSLAGTTLVIDSLVAYSDGPVAITGEIDVAEPAEPVFDLVVNVENSRVVDREEVQMRIDAELTITGPLAAVEVRGDAYARSGMLRIPTLDELGSGNIVNLDDPATYQLSDTLFMAERDRLFPRRTFDNLQIDVGLTLDRDVWLRSTEANVEIYTPPDVGPLRVVMNGADSDINLLGTINTDRGTYEFMSRRFNLTRGAVTFTGEGELNPFIQLAAEHEVRLPGREAFQVRVVIGGTLQDFALTLESTAQPPISQTDLLSYVAFGRDASSLLYQQGSGLTGQGDGAGGLVGNVAGMAAQQLAAVALEAAVNEIESEAMRELRLDVFRITPADLPAEMFTGSYIDVLRGTEIEAGRYVSPRLFVAGQVRAGLNRPGIRMEYWTPQGFQWHAAWQPRFLPSEPTLTDQDPRRAGVLGTFLFREWRF